MIVGGGEEKILSGDQLITKPNVLLSLLNTPTIILFNLFELSSQSRMETDSLNSTDCYRERIPSTNFVQPNLRAGLSSL